MDYRDSSDYSEMLEKARAGDAESKQKILEVVRQKYAGDREGLQLAESADMEEAAQKGHGFTPHMFGPSTSEGFYPNKQAAEEQMADDISGVFGMGSTRIIGKGAQLAKNTLPKVGALLSKAPKLGTAVVPASAPFGPKTQMAKAAMDKYIAEGNPINTPEFSRLQKLFNSLDKAGK